MSSIVLLSGGMDSCGALVLAVRADPHVEALMVDYGQPHRDQELAAGQALARALAIPYTVVPVITAALASERLWNVNRVAEGPHPATVPGRNMLFLSLATALAARRFAHGDLAIWIGATKDDAAGFADCRREFLDAAAQALSLGIGRRVAVVAPWIEQSKQDMVERADHAVLAAFRGSWSCYRGGSKPCGECDPCVLRADAFGACGIADSQHAIPTTGGDLHRERR